MALFWWRNLLSLTLVAFLPVSLAADESAVAVLRSVSGTVLVNQSASPASIAVFRGDTIETRPDSSAWMEYRGSTVEIDAETIIRLEDGEIILDHGSVTVTSFQQLRVHVGCVTAIPVNAEKTIYFVTDRDSRVTVNAQEKDVNLDSNSSNLKHASHPESAVHEVVHQGEKKSRDEHCGGGDLKGASSGASGGVLNSWPAVASGMVFVTAGTLCVLLCFNDQPPSPHTPSNSSITANHP